MQDLQAHICVCNNDVELFVEGHELGRHALEIMFAAAEEHHLVWLFLFIVSVLSTAHIRGPTYSVACEPNTLECVAHQEHTSIWQVLEVGDIALHIHESDR